MHDLEKKLLKDVLHLIVDKGEPAVIDYIIGRLPEKIQPVLQALKSAVISDVQSIEDKLIEGM